MHIYIISHNTWLLVQHYMEIRSRIQTKKKHTNEPKKYMKFIKLCKLKNDIKN